jgi:uncharacterized membrane protein (Fun14 family)
MGTMSSFIVLGICGYLIEAVLAVVILFIGVFLIMLIFKD